MICAIYSRKSNEQNGVADDAKSVSRQTEHAKTYAAKKGWTVAEEHVYMDDGISGAEFVKRPGLARLMNALKPRPAFQHLIVMEQSRLGRSLDEVPYVLKRIADAGVHMWCYLTDAEVKRETATDKFMVSAVAFVDDMHREQSSERTRDAMVRKALAGHVTGGRLFGFDNLEIRTPDGKRSHVTRRIYPEQADVV